jgi:hypothetical protein
MNECCRHLFREAKKELEIKDRRISFLESEVTRVFEPTKDFWNKNKDQTIQQLEDALRDILGVASVMFDALNDRQNMDEAQEEYIDVINKHEELLSKINNQLNDNK